MIKNLLSLFLIFYSSSILYAQDNSSLIVGEWLLSSIKITNLSVEEEYPVNESNCYWADVKKIGKPIFFKDDGTVTFFKILFSEEPTEVNVRYLISGGELKLIFSNETASVKGNGDDFSKSGIESYTVYDFSLQSNSRLVLSSQYPTLQEEYIFTKKIN